VPAQLDGELASLEFDIHRDACFANDCDPDVASLALVGLMQVDQHHVTSQTSQSHDL
jgi:hypothetical protein